MKKLIYYGVLLAIVTLAIPFQAIAQTELMIYATPNSLDAVINADQASGTPADIYTLVSTDTTYIFEDIILINNDVIIRGTLAEDGRPPCIQPLPNTEGAVPGRLFSFAAEGSTVKLENLYLLGLSTVNSINLGDGMAVSINADNINCHIDNVIFEQWSQFSINYTGNGCSFWVTNSKFRNNVNSGSLYTGQGFRIRNWAGASEVDTVIMKHNTFLATNAYAMTATVGGFGNYLEFTHNTVVAMSKNPFFNMNATDWKVKHNLFYDVYTAGMSDGEYPWWDRVWAGGLGATIDLDPLNKLNAGRLGIDTTQADAVWQAEAEAARNIDVIDNIYYRSPEWETLYQTINDTATTINDSVLTTPWMNETTMNMFSNDTAWPGLVDENNTVINPGLGTTYVGLLGAPGATIPEENGVGHISYIDAARANQGAAGVEFGYSISAPNNTEDWVPTWPLPEETDLLLKYTEPLTAMDGLPFGDQYWFTGTPVGVEEKGEMPQSFELSQNYPNPFNPATIINFAIPENGIVTLKVYDMLGREVLNVMSNTQMPAGSHNITVDMSGYSSGVYLYRINYNNTMLSKKMLLMK